MRKAIATLGITATLLGGGAALLPAAAKAAPPPKDTTDQQRRLCERSGGTFIDLDGVARICLLPKV
jgi:hypothetical protein